MHSVPPSPLQAFTLGRRGQRVPLHTPRLKGTCRCLSCAQRRAWTPERRAAWSARVRARWADGTRVLRRNPNEHRASRWHPGQEEALRRLAGQHDCLTLARMLTERFGVLRSEAAVVHRLKRLGISRMDARPLSSSEVGRIFGVTRETVRVRFVGAGLLVGTLRRGGPHGMRMFSRAEIERLVRDHPESYDRDAIRDPSLRALAQAVVRGRRLLGTAEVSAMTGVAARTLSMWLLRGRLPSARKVRGVRPGRGGAWLIPAGDVDLVRALRDGRAERQRANLAARRDGLSGRAT